MLATLVARKHGTDQVEWEHWGDFEVCSGPLLRMWSQEPPLSYQPVLDGLKQKLLGAGLSQELHWVRVFVAVDNGKPMDALDALLDNDPWQPGVEFVRNYPWPAAEQTYALRHFLMLVPADRLS